MDQSDKPQAHSISLNLIFTLRRIESKLDQIHQNAQLSNKPVLDILEAASLLRMSKFTLYTMTSKRILPFFKVGRKIFFDREELLDFVRSKKHKFKSISEIESETATLSIIKGRGQK
ncbi:MAG: helix-turn-helix domain-containing protein [Candidatus Thorarchaeota archaeon]